MKRTLVSQEYLLQWMNSQIAEYEDYADCHFTSVVPLRESDEYGCNWSGADLMCSGMPLDVCQPIAQRIIDAAKKKFNVG